ncbi:MAG: type I-E CRISPR-associated protein Cas7/Cse4/CasC [Dehalococcoidia bacterium]|nr:type I-E CRISPR-associated protein Cas7/Cse4/CasC [Dehalococcoidia bacterium]
MSDSGIKIEVHLIQNFAPSNLNRDDTGQPKSAYFGGVRRARVSSQCGKRAARLWWEAHGTVEVGHRTKRLQQLICERLAQDSEFVARVPNEQDRKDGVRVFTDAYYAAADRQKRDNTSVLLFVSPAEVAVCADLVKKIWEDEVTETASKSAEATRLVEGISSVLKKVRAFDAKHASKGSDSKAGGDDESGEEAATIVSKAPKRPQLGTVPEFTNRIKSAQMSADIALFGRMLAEQPGRNTDGACQVAHPISTHKVDMEMDFYTAVDDLNPAEETGAGMMGVTGFNSACYYRYALIDRDQLARNLACKTEQRNKRWIYNLEPSDYQEADAVISAFLEAMVYAIPTGKQHAFAAQNLPSFGLFVRRQGGVPISLANAFSRPIHPTRTDDDIVGLSIGALAEHWDEVSKVYGNQGVQTTSCFHTGADDRLGGLKHADRGNVQEAIDAVMETVRAQ